MHIRFSNAVQIKYVFSLKQELDVNIHEQRLLLLFFQTINQFKTIKIRKIEFERKIAVLKSSIMILNYLVRLPMSFKALAVSL